jgi:phenylacetate-coenzyme A ligase PaaK-like adenylate-forming protein
MRLMDTARGAYVRSPAFVRRSIAPVVSLAPARLKYGAGYRRERERITRAAADPAFAASAHLAALRALLRKAHAGSPFYREQIDKAFGPAFDVTKISLADLRRLPILGKEDLRRAGDAALATPKLLLDQAETSGSNAEPPFGFYLDKDRSTRELAFVYDVWAGAGYGESDARACLRGVGVDGDLARLHQWDPALRELKLSAFPMTRNDAALYLDLIDKRRIRYLYGYPSSVELICRHMQALGRWPKLPVRGLLLISEPVYEHQRRIFSEVLGNVPLACFYGLSEKALFAAERPDEPGTYNFNPLYGLAELVDEGGVPVTEPGRQGRLIGTGFLSTGMPFIRYDTGDFARLVALPTSENGQRLAVRAIMPRRKPDFLVSRDGSRLVTVDLTPEDAKFFSGIAEFQFFQEAPGEVVIRYVPGPHGTAADAEKLRQDLQGRAKGQLSFSIRPVVKIAAGRGGKRAFIDQRLDISKY